MAHQSSSAHADSRSEIGEEFFAGPSTAAEYASAQQTAQGMGAFGTDNGRSQTGSVGARPLERSAPVVSTGWGRGPRPIDKRKYKYDVARARASPAIAFNATKLDTMDAVQAGDMLHKIHQRLGIDGEIESRINAFDKALWLEHTLNGASLVQPGHGVLRVGSGDEAIEVDIRLVTEVLGTEARRFFRAFADDIADVNREVLDAYDAYDPEAAEKAANIKKVAFSRGLAKYPYLAHDSADACNELSYDERMAVEAASARVLPNSANPVEQMAELATQSRQAKG